MIKKFWISTVSVKSKIFYSLGFLNVLVIVYFVLSPKSNSISGTYRSFYESDSFTEYIEIHDQIVRNLRNNNTGRISIVEYQDIGHLGYANRVYGLIDSMLVAVLTDSALFVDWKKIYPFMSPPLSNSFNYTSLFNFSSQHPDSVVHMPYDTRNTWKLVKNLTLLLESSIPVKSYKNRTVYKVSSNAAFFLEICSNPIYHAKLLKYGLVKKETIQEAHKRLNYSRSNIKDILNYNITNRVEENLNKNLNLQEALMRIGYEAGSNLLKRLWLPQPYILDELKIYSTLYDLENSLVIGMHVRFEYLNDPQDIYYFVNCALEIENNLMLSSSSKIKKVKWFVASDSQKLIDRLKATYPNKVVAGEGVVAHVAENATGFRRTVVDIEMLSRSEELIITGGSTFGFVAGLKLKNGKMPYYINGRENKYEKCKRVELARPPKTSWQTASF